MLPAALVVLIDAAYAAKLLLQRTKRIVCTGSANMAPEAATLSQAASSISCSVASTHACMTEQKRLVAPLPQYKSLQTPTHCALTPTCHNTCTTSDMYAVPITWSVGSPAGM